MNLRRIGRVGAAVVGVGVLLATSITAATATSTYKGTLTYGAPTVHVTCSGSPSVPTSVAVSFPYDATHWNTSAPMTVVSEYNPSAPGDYGYASVTGPTSMIRAGQSGIITASLKVPTDAASLPDDTFYLGTYRQMVGPVVHYTPSCSSPDSEVPVPPTEESVSHPCLGTTTVAVSNGSAAGWTTEARNISQQGIVFIPARSSATVTIGSALQGAEHFVIVFQGPGPSADLPLLYSAACVPGHPVTTFSAVHRYSQDVLTATARTGPVSVFKDWGEVTTRLPLVGAPVSFYRIWAGKRILIGTGHTGPHGISVLSASHRGRTTYVAVIGPTHYSLPTATVSRYVP